MVSRHVLNLHTNNYCYTNHYFNRNFTWDLWSAGTVEGFCVSADRSVTYRWVIARDVHLLLASSARATRCQSGWHSSRTSCHRTRPGSPPGNVSWTGHGLRCRLSRSSRPGCPSLAVATTTVGWRRVSRRQHAKRCSRSGPGSRAVVHRVYRRRRPSPVVRSTTADWPSSRCTGPSRHRYSARTQPSTASDCHCLFQLATCRVQARQRARNPLASSSTLLTAA